jgi:hypothetical protein
MNFHLLSLTILTIIIKGKPNSWRRSRISMFIYLYLG